MNCKPASKWQKINSHRIINNSPMQLERGSASLEGYKSVPSRVKLKRSSIKFPVSVCRYVADQESKTDIETRPVLKTRSIAFLIHKLAREFNKITPLVGLFIQLALLISNHQQYKLPNSHWFHWTINKKTLYNNWYFNNHLPNPNKPRWVSTSVLKKLPYFKSFNHDTQIPKQGKENFLTRNSLIILSNTRENSITHLINKIYAHIT